MSYRDDHDAALSRIAALEQELAQARHGARETSARDTRIIEMLEREIAELRRGDSNAPRRVRPSATSRPAPPPAATPSPTDELEHRGPSISKVLFALLLAVAIGAVAFGIVLARDDHHDRLRTTCTLDTRPPHARVFGIDGAREVDLGEAPVELAFRAWFAYDKIELRLSGHDTLTVDPPITPVACPNEPYDLP